MKQITIFVIIFYQKTISIILKSLIGVTSACRFSPSCSEYAKVSINKFGVIKGSYLSLARILSCQPYFKFK